LSLIVLLQARNEERYVPGWLENIGPAVDGIVALDDGSTDRTAALLRTHPKLLALLHNPAGSGWDEPGNQARLIEEGRRHGATWFLALDADERVEKLFASRVRELMAEATAIGADAYLFHLREMWGDRNHYRSDGIWRDKAQFRLFRNLPGKFTFDDRPHHRSWLPLEIKNRLGAVGFGSGLSIYHLKMIAPADRAARVARYEALDPDASLQAIGYAYLADETGLRLTRIRRKRRFLPAKDAGIPPLPPLDRLKSWGWRVRASLVRLMGRRPAPSLTTMAGPAGEASENPGDGRPA
jgi:hypothetical protein